MSNYEKKIVSCFDIREVLEALRSGIGTCLVFAFHFFFSNIVLNNGLDCVELTLKLGSTKHTNSLLSKSLVSLWETSVHIYGDLRLTSGQPQCPLRVTSGQTQSDHMTSEYG